MKYLGLIVVMAAMISAASALDGTATYGDITAVSTDGTGNSATATTTSYDVTYTGWNTFATFTPNIEPLAVNDGMQDTVTSAYAAAIANDPEWSGADVASVTIGVTGDTGFDTFQSAVSPQTTVSAYQDTSAYVTSGSATATANALEGLGNNANQYANLAQYDWPQGNTLDTEMLATADIDLGVGPVSAAQETTISLWSWDGSAIVSGYSASDAFHAGDNTYSNVWMDADNPIGSYATLTTTGVAQATDTGSSSWQIWDISPVSGYVGPQEASSYAEANVGVLQATANGYWNYPDMTAITTASQNIVIPNAGIV